MFFNIIYKNVHNKLYSEFLTDTFSLVFKLKMDFVNYLINSYNDLDIVERMQ